MAASTDFLLADEAAFDAFIVNRSTPIVFNGAALRGLIAGKRVKTDEARALCLGVMHDIVERDFPNRRQTEQQLAVHGISLDFQLARLEAELHNQIIGFIARAIAVKINPWH